jgi:acyl dehydratase
VKNPNSDPVARNAVPVWNQDVKLYEDYAVGEIDRSIRRTISEGEVMIFSSMLVDLHPYVADEIFARDEGLFGRRIVPGALVFGYGMGLMAHNNVNTFSYGYDRLRFIKPVFIGDTIRTRTTITAKEDDPKRPGSGRVIERCEVINQRGEVVLAADHIYIVERKPA